MILKASAENGSASSALRSTWSSSRLGRWPSTGGTSSGDGRYWTTASRTSCTPLFLNAEPHSTGTPPFDSVAARMARRSSSTVGSSSAMNFSMRASSWSASFSNSSWRARSRGLLVLGGDVGVLPVLPHLALPVVALHLHEVDDPVQLGLGAPRELQDQRVGAQPVDDHVHRALEVRAGAVHLVHEADARHVVAVRLAPHGLGLRLHAGDGVEDRDGAVEHAQRLRSTSTVKSTWPGVSMMLIQWPFH